MKTGCRAPTAGVKTGCRAPGADVKTGCRAPGPDVKTGCRPVFIEKVCETRLLGRLGLSTSKHGQAVV